jgi:putative membrane protein
MGFGFVVARFGLFLQALQIGSNHQVQPSGVSFWFGTALIVLGVFVCIVCARNHIHLVQELNRGGPSVHRPSSLAVAVAVILAVLGLAMAVYLVSIREPASARVAMGKEGYRVSTLSQNADRAALPAAGTGPLLSPTSMISGLSPTGAHTGRPGPFGSPFFVKLAQ